MNKKTGLQVVLVLVIVIISLWFYLKYFTKNSEDVKDVPVIEKIDENLIKKFVWSLYERNALKSILSEYFVIPTQ